MDYLKTNLICVDVVSLSLDIQHDVGMKHDIVYEISERVSSGFLYLLLLKCYYYWYPQYCCFKVIKNCVCNFSFKSDILMPYLYGYI